MSRVGKKAILIPEKTKIAFGEQVLTAEGAKGKLQRSIHPSLNLKIEKGQIEVICLKDTRECHALQGLTRTLINNMIVGVNKGFERILEINGIGYRAEAKPKSIVFYLGYSHPIDFNLPEGVTVNVDKGIIKLFCIDKELLGLTSAAIRRLRPPEPYKGKGIKYSEERIIKKAGKTGTK